MRISAAVSASEKKDPAILLREMLREIDACNNLPGLNALTKKLAKSPSLQGLSFYSWNYLRLLVDFKKIELAKKPVLESVFFLYQKIPVLLADVTKAGARDDFRSITLTAQILLLMARLEKLLYKFYNLSGNDEGTGRRLPPVDLHDVLDQCVAVKMRIDQLIQQSLDSNDTRILRAIHPGVETSSDQPEDQDEDLLAWELSFLDREFSKLLWSCWEAAGKECLKLQEYFMALLKRRCHGGKDSQVIAILKKSGFISLLSERSPKKLTKNKKLDAFFESFKWQKRRLDYCAIRASLEEEKSNNNKKKQGQFKEFTPAEKEYLGAIRECILLRHDFDLFATDNCLDNKRAGKTDKEFDKRVLSLSNLFGVLISLHQHHSKFDLSNVPYYEDGFQDFVRAFAQDEHAPFSTAEELDITLTVILQKMLIDHSRLERKPAVSAEFRRIQGGILDILKKSFPKDSGNQIFFSTLCQLILDWVCTYLTGLLAPEKYCVDLSAFNGLELAILQFMLDHISTQGHISESQIHDLCVTYQSVIKLLTEDKDSRFSGLAYLILYLFQIKYSQIEPYLKPTPIGAGHIAEFQRLHSELLQRCKEELKLKNLSATVSVSSKPNKRDKGSSAAVQAIAAPAESPASQHIASGSGASAQKAVTHSEVAPIEKSTAPVVALVTTELIAPIKAAIPVEESVSQQAASTGIMPPEKAVVTATPASQKSLAAVSKKSPKPSDSNAWQRMLQNAQDVREKARALEGLIRCYDKIKTNNYLKTIKKYAKQLFHLVVYENPENIDLSEYVRSIIPIIDSHKIFRIPKDKPIPWNLRIGHSQSLSVINYLKKRQLADGFGRIVIYGGFVRDTLLGAQPEDVDICVDRNIKNLLECLQEGLAEMGAIACRQVHGSIYLAKVKFEDGSEMDVCSLREDQQYPLMLALYKKVTGFNFNINRPVYLVDVDEIWDLTDALEIYTKRIFLFSDEYNQRALCEQGKTPTYFQQPASDRPESFFQALDILAKCRRRSLKMKLGDPEILLPKLEKLKLPLEEQPRKQINNVLIKLVCRGYASAIYDVFRKFEFIPFIALFPQFLGLITEAIVQAHLKTCCETVDQTYLSKPEFKKADWDLRTIYFLSLLFSILPYEKTDTQLCLFWSSYRTSRLVRLALEKKEPGEDNSSYFPKALLFFEEQYRLRLEERARPQNQSLSLEVPGFTSSAK